MTISSPRGNRSGARQQGRAFNWLTSIRLSQYFLLPLFVLVLTISQHTNSTSSYSLLQDFLAQQEDAVAAALPRRREEVDELSSSSRVGIEIHSDTSVISPPAASEEVPDVGSNTGDNNLHGDPKDEDRIERIDSKGNNERRDENREDEPKLNESQDEDKKHSSRDEGDAVDESETDGTSAANDDRDQEKSSHENPDDVINESRDDAGDDENESVTNNTIVIINNSEDKSNRETSGDKNVTEIPNRDDAVDEKSENEIATNNATVDINHSEENQETSRDETITEMANREDTDVGEESEQESSNNVTTIDVNNSEDTSNRETSLDKNITDTLRNENSFGGDNSSIENSTIAILKTYRGRRAAVVSSKEHTPSKKDLVQVHVMLGPTAEISAQSRFLIEGVERSQYMKLIHISFLEHIDQVDWLEMNYVDTNMPLVWLVDWNGIHHDCHALESLARHAVDFDSNSTEQRSLLLVDYSGKTDPVVCDKAFEIVGRTNVRIAQRNIVRNRFWDEESKWVQAGEVVSPNPGRNISGGPVIHTPFPLRETVVNEVLRLTDIQRKKRQLDKLRPVDTMRGASDVVHFWRKGDNSHYAFLRKQVSTVITALHGTMVGDRKLKTLVRAFGMEEGIERNLVQSRYIQEMMDTKAIVVAQRDEWEDHYRLMESLGTGSLVFSDYMQTLPPTLVHGKSILIYDSMASLRELLLYYLHPNQDKLRLSIAKKGWEVAMGHNRCWHRVEGLIFGKSLTSVDKVYEDLLGPPRRRRVRYDEIQKELELAEVAVEGNGTGLVKEEEEDAIS